LLGYLFFQLYRSMECGQSLAGKSLPVALKNHVDDGPKSVVIYSGRYFGVFGFLEFVRLYSTLSHDVMALLNPILSKV